MISNAMPNIPDKLESLQHLTWPIGKLVPEDLHKASRNRVQLTNRNTEAHPMANVRPFVWGR